MSATLIRDNDVVIAGYSETKIIAKCGRSAYDLAGEAFSLLLAAAPIGKDAIDGLSVTLSLSEAPNPFFAVNVAEALGIMPSWLNAGALGGCSVVSGIARAAAAIREGSCTSAVVISADAPTTFGRAHLGAYRPEFQDPQGVQSPPATFGLLMNRYDNQFGLSERALAKLAVTQRAGAVVNENAVEKFRVPLTEEDYLHSRMIADPLRVLDCVMFCDGANAFLVTTAGRARALGLQRMVRVSAYAEVTNYLGTEAQPDITDNGHQHIAPKVFAQAGLRAADIKQFHPYDDFTIAIVLQLEAYGFCARGEGSAYILATDFSPGGALPLNTGGGQISAGQPGLAGGGVNLAEAVRQMFGDAGSRQIADPHNALVTGIGLIPYGRNWSVSAALILEA